MRIDSVSGIAGRGDSSLIRPVPDAETLLVKVQGREICIDRIQICVRVIIVLVAGINPVTAEW